MEYWDLWEERAKAAGVGPELAALGRSLMRDHFQHGLDRELELGAEADGPLMLDLALNAPLHAESRFAGDLLARQSDLSADEIEWEVARVMAARVGGPQRLEELMERESATADACWRRAASQ